MLRLWWVRSDPCGMFSAGLTVALVLFAYYVVVKQILLPWLGFTHHIVTFTLLSLLSLISHTRAQFTDPGSIPLSLSPPPLPHSDVLALSPYPCPPGPKICKVCFTIKSPQAYHCGTCKRCIIRMDHHCPWVNNCVAIHNQKYFILFLIYTALCCIFTAGVLSARFFSCSSSPRQCNVTGLGTALGIVTFIEALIFGLFVIIMMFDQLTAIFEVNQDEMQHYQQQLSSYEYNIKNNIPVYGPKPVKPVARSKYESLCAVFGETISWRWLFPFNLPSSVNKAFQHEIDVGIQNADQAIANINKHIELVTTMIEKRSRADASTAAANALMTKHRDLDPKGPNSEYTSRTSMKTQRDELADMMFDGGVDEEVDHDSQDESRELNGLGSLESAGHNVFNTTDYDHNEDDVEESDVEDKTSSSDYAPSDITGTARKRNHIKT